MKHLLVVDDEEKIRSLIRKYAEFEGYTVDEASNGMDALDLFSKGSYDLVVMDIMMPGLDGLSASREIRKKSDVPIIMLSARGEEYDRIGGFQLGVDDYVVKPFSPKELMLRIEAILKRTGAQTKKENAEGDAPSENAVKREIFTLEGLEIDFTARIVKIDGKVADLSPKEYELLFYLVRNRNIALSREKLICEVWGYDFFGDDRTLDTHIKLLRQSLGPYSKFIVTLRGVGYRFESSK
jgi:two-component system, OmpR family, response regulator ResD